MGLKKARTRAKKKLAKKSVMEKVLKANRHKSHALMDILKESDNLNTMSVNRNPTESTKIKSDDEYLKNFYNAPKGGPKHSIAVNRAHHLTNFLRDYILNAFQSGLFPSPDFHVEEIYRTKHINDKFRFEITNVELLADLTFLKIYWSISGIENLDRQIEEYFDKHLKSLIRGTLSSERVINYVPKVIFIRDETQVLLNRVDEYLDKVKKETTEFDENEIQTAENDSEVKRDDEPESIKKVNNLYGVDFNRLIQSIKSNTPILNTEFKSDESSSLSSINNNSQSSLVNVDLDKINEDKLNFEKQLKAIQINKRIKYEKLNKSALLRLSLLEIENKKHEL